jgi:hypothetical protein
MFARLTIFEDLDLSLERQFLDWASTEGLRFSRELPGYQGLLTLIDREHRRLVGLGLYDSAENLEASHEIMDGAPPDSMPEAFKRALPRRSFVGLFEVVERDGV